MARTRSTSEYKATMSLEVFDLPATGPPMASSSFYYKRNERGHPNSGFLSNLLSIKGLISSNTVFLYPFFCNRFSADSWS
jgi:hypothetical protein